MSDAPDKTARAFLPFLASALLVTLIQKEALASFEVQRILVGDIPDETPGLGGAVRPRRDEYLGDYGTSSIEPLYFYEGRWLYSNGTSGGVHIVDTDWFYFDLNARFRFTKLDQGDVERLGEGLKTRDSTVEAGFATGLRTPFGDLRIEWGHDVLDRHDGESLELTYRYMFENGDVTFSPFITASFLDANLANYYYGVSEAEAQATGLPAYEVGDTTNVSIGLNSYWQATEHIFLFANLGFEILNRDIVESPIVNADFAAEMYVGGGYFFGSLGNSKYVSSDRAGEWSWRVQYGYAGDSNIVPEPMQGDLRRSELVSTKIAGFAVGKLIQEARLMDMYGKFAVYRHFEDGFQDDFWSFAPYVMGIGKGYMPWSDKVAFRWGFGMGLSYAQRIPAIEQIKQENKQSAGSNRLLTYLEWTVDLPIDAVIKSKLVRNCFVGVTVVHRSGIFGYSRANDDVRGGSDYYTLHLECLR